MTASALVSYFQSCWLVVTLCLLTSIAAHAQEATPSPSSGATQQSAAPAPPPPVTRKTAWVAHLLRRTPDNLRLKTLNFANTQLAVLLIARPGTLRPLVEIQGQYERAGWTLYAQNSPVSQAVGKSDFKFYAYLNAKISEVVLTTKGPNGESEEERIYLFAPEAQEFMLISPWNSVVLAPGFSAIDYFQTGFGNYLAYTGTLSVKYATFDGPKQLGLYASLDFTALTFASQPVDRGPQFIEGKIDGTLTLPFAPQSRWKTQLIGGLSYVTMLSNGSPFGFSNLIAPEAGIRTRYIANVDDAYIADLRYVPLGTESPFTDGGFLANLTWSRTLTNSHRAEFGINYSYYSYQPETGTTIRFGILTFQVGYSI